jgi:hypothetical protein
MREVDSWKIDPVKSASRLVSALPAANKNQALCAFLVPNPRTDEKIPLDQRLGRCPSHTSSRQR